MGTIDYVAPEQIAGEEIDGRADVYSLGCVLYECLVGQPPFRRDSDIAVVFAHLETEPPAPSAERPELPAALDAVIARALENEPEQRYPSCRAFVGAALAVAADEASRLLVDAASRAAAGRSELNVVEAELAGNVRDLQRVREQARVLTAPVTPPVGSDVTCLYKGLASFEPVDADQFFGRERLVAELVARCVGAGFPASSARRAAASHPCCERASSPRSPEASSRTARAGGASSCVPASGRSTSYAACSCRGRRIRCVRPSTPCP